VRAVYELDKSRFGAFVAQLRREKGWTQRQLAERLFVSDKAVSKWETGVSRS
jgi:transcriptional regulator with XRE-family HTH domain